MGYSFQAVQLNKADVVALYGSRDDEILQRMTDPTVRYARSLMHTDDNEDWDSIELFAFKEILDGAACTQLEPHVYGYAIEAFCFEFGEALGEVDTRDDWRTKDLATKYEISIFDFFELLDAEWPIPIRDTPEYPLVAFFDWGWCRENLDPVLSLVNAVEKCADWEEEAGLEAAKNYAKWFKSASDAETDLVIFNH